MMKRDYKMRSCWTVSCMRRFDVYKIYVTLISCFWKYYNKNIWRWKEKNAKNNFYGKKLSVLAQFKYIE